VRGDRSANVDDLINIDAEVVIDTSGYTPDAVRASALAVAARVRQYVFVSTIDAYDLTQPEIDESSATRVLPAGAQTSEMDVELYGAHKARCERELVEILGPERVTIVRAGLMAGPYDATDRFTYWPVRVERGGDVLAPRERSMPVQLVDVRDVACWVVGSIAQKLSGVFNLTGNPGELTIGDVLEIAQRATGSDARFTWVPDSFLVERAVAPWIEMPLWLPADLEEFRGLLRIRNERARATGLRLRPLDETIRDVLAEYHQRDKGWPLRAGLSSAREAELLASWLSVKAS